MRLTLGERGEIVKRLWPDVAIGDLLNRAVLVHDVELGLPVPTLSRAERERIEEELRKAERNG